MDYRRTSSYTYGTSSRDGVVHHTSSAFSASAQPNEDWTKISDLAERRRIQNRIAQRNYRKKLKKRLEDLERKAASTSTSPEPQPLPSKKPPRQNLKSSKRSTSSTSSKRRQPSPTQSTTPPQSRIAVEDWTMFSSQHTRQLSTSPPPFQFPTIDSFQTPPSPQLPAGNFSYLPPATDPIYQFQPYFQPVDPSFPWQDKTLSVKQEGFLESEISPLSLPGYMPITSVDVSFASSFPESLTPELCDIYEYSSAGSPGDFNTFPQTPMMLPLSPPFQSFDQL